jgi:hypothetical protein
MFEREDQDKLIRQELALAHGQDCRTGDGGQTSGSHIRKIIQAGKGQASLKGSFKGAFSLVPWCSWRSMWLSSSRINKSGIVQPRKAA